VSRPQPARAAAAGGFAAAARRGGGGRRLRLAPFGDERRARLKPLGLFTDGPRCLAGLYVPDSCHHCHVIGTTGSGKSTWQCHLCVAEAWAGRGVALFDCQGDLGLAVLRRLPRSCAQRLVIIDPGETVAPPAWNPLQVPPGGSGELVAENVLGVFRRLYATYWGPRMEDTLRAACLTLVQRPNSTLADVVPLLTNSGFRAHLLGRYGEPEGLAGFWSDWEQTSPAERRKACGPVVSRLRAIFTRRFARDLLATGASTFSLTDILDGGVLIVRVPKGLIGEDCARLVGSLLLAGLWQAATARADRPYHRRPVATVIVDECQNFLHLPIGVEDVLAEARGYRMGVVLAHQHLAQLPTEVRDAVDANALNKLIFRVSPTDAARLARHVAPLFDEHDLSRRPARQITCRILVEGDEQPAFTVNTLPPGEPIPGRERELRAAARARTGLGQGYRARAGLRARVATRSHAHRSTSGTSGVRSASPALGARRRALGGRRAGDSATTASAPARRPHPASGMSTAGRTLAGLAPGVSHPLPPASLTALPAVLATAGERHSDRAGATPSRP
jgi:hypothetical protein